MADREIDQLPEAGEVKLQDLFLLRQDGSAKKLTGETLKIWLLRLAEGHGGIVSQEQISAIGLDVTYRMTYADGSTFDYTVRNGRSISGITQFFAVSTSGTDAPDVFSPEYQPPTPEARFAWGFMRYTFDNGSSLDTEKTLVAAYGDTGLQTYVHIRWANNSAPSDAEISTVPDDYIGIYTGTDQAAPTRASSYIWSRFRGLQGDKGDPATPYAIVISYGASNSTSAYPSQWFSSISSVPIFTGAYVWTRCQYIAEDGSVASAAYSVSHIGADGTGSGTVRTVTFGGATYTDVGGDVSIPMPTAGDVGAIAEPPSRGDGQFLAWDAGAGRWVASTPTGSVTTVNGVGVTAGTTNIQLSPNNIGLTGKNLLDNPRFQINQRCKTIYNGETYTVDRWTSRFSGGNGVTTVLETGGIRIYRPTDFAYAIQYLDEDVRNLIRGKTVTISMICDNGQASIGLSYKGSATEYCPSGTGVVSATLDVPNDYYDTVAVAIRNVTGNPVDIKAVKLELGSVSTLANDVPPNLAEELLKCQRYFVRLDAIKCPIAPVLAWSTTKIYPMVVLPTAMRASPSISIVGTLAVQSRTSGYHDVTDVVLGNYQPNRNEVRLDATTSGLTAGEMVFFRNKQGISEVYLDLIADL